MSLNKLPFPVPASLTMNAELNILTLKIHTQGTVPVQVFNTVYDRKTEIILRRRLLRHCES
jgi:hypothetical protein